MLTRHALALAAAVALSVGLASPAAAGGKVVCDKGRCKVIATNPGTPGGETGGGGGSNAQPASTGGGSEISPAEWAAILAKRRAEDAANLKDAATQTCSGGSTYVAEYQTCGAYDTPPTPGQPVQPPTYTPWDAAQEALENLPLRRPSIGAAPCNTDVTTADCVGTVGLPVWVWTEPWTPATATATAGPFTVTATATISSVRWELGDGTQFTCTTPGTEFNVAFGFRAPDCGKPNGYQKAGDYAITATYQWDISWSGATSGSTTMQTRATTPTFPVSELQAVITHH